MIDYCVWRGQGKIAYPDGRQDYQPFDYISTWN